MKKDSGYEKLKKQTSLKDILEVAIEFERTACNFYQDLTPKVSKNFVIWLKNWLKKNNATLNCSVN